MEQKCELSKEQQELYDAAVRLWQVSFFPQIPQPAALCLLGLLLAHV